MKKLLTILFFYINVCNAQHETDNWLFGDKCYIKWITADSFINVSGSKMVTKYIQGNTTSISDTSGNLLFYSNGRRIWNKEHNIMFNGDSLFCDSASFLSLQISPTPNNKNIYYLFYVDSISLRQPKSKILNLYYCIVDMSMDSGRGKVIQKNKLLQNFATDRLLITKHYNGKDIWIITHKDLSNTYTSFLLCENRLDTVPIISNTGYNFNTGDNFSSSYLIYGSMNITNNQKFITTMISDLGTGIIRIEVLKFNSKTGILELNQSIPLPFLSVNIPFSILSRNNKFLYISNDTIMRQLKISVSDTFIVDLNSNSINGISRRNYLFRSNDDLISIGSITVFPGSTTDSLSKIRNTNNVVNKYNYNHNYKNVNGTPFLILPVFPSYFDEPINFSYEQTYQQMQTQFKPYSCYDSVNWHWDFGDITSGINNSSNQKYPTHTYSDSGTYNVMLITDRIGFVNDTNIKTIKINYNPKPFLGNDTILCAGQGITLTSPFAYDKHLWSNGDTTNTISITTSGTYILKTYKYYNGSCDALEKAVNADTININFIPYPQKITQRKYYICKGKTVTLTAENTGMKYLWNTNDTSQHLIANAEGKYIVKIRNQQCSVYDTIEVLNFNVLKPVIGKLNNQLISTKGNTYKWFSTDTLIPNESKQQFAPKYNGYYRVSINDSNGCEAMSDSFYFEKIFSEVKIYPNPSRNIFTVELPNQYNELYALELYDAIGQRLQLNYTTNEGVSIIDLSDYAPAYYFLKITNTSGSFWVKKIVKQ